MQRTRLANGIQSKATMKRSKSSIMGGRIERVLEALKASKTPLSAYDLIDCLEKEGERIAPTQMYRLLKSLTAEGRVLRVESQNAFIATDHVHAPHEPVALLVCECCGKVEEADAASIAPALIPTANARGFTPHRSTLEVLGECGQCREQTD